MDLWSCWGCGMGFWTLSSSLSDSYHTSLANFYESLLSWSIRIPRMKSCHYRFCPPRLWLLATAPNRRYHFDFSLKNGIGFRSLIYQLHRLYSYQLSRMLCGCCSSYIALFYPSKRPQSLGSRFLRLRRCRILRWFGTTQVYSAASTSYRIPIQIFSWYRRWSGCLCCRGRVGWMLLAVL